MIQDESQNDGEGNTNLSSSPFSPLNTVRFSVVLFSIRDETDDYSCIFCDFKTFEKNKHDDHLFSNHRQELKENYCELLKELPVLPTKNYQNVNPI